MASQDSPRHGRVSPINVSAPASVRGFVPLTENSTAEGRSVQYVGDANVDRFVNSESNRSTNTARSPAQDGRPSNLSTFTSIVFFYVDTCCVWGGFGRFRPASTWRHNPVPFISQVPGGYYAGLTPPFIPVFVSFYFAYTTTANG